MGSVLVSYGSPSFECNIKASLLDFDGTTFVGNVMNGPIGKQMVDTLVESSANFEVR